MVMFDWYVPKPPLACPSCSAALDGWQGKDGPCHLFEWVQGVGPPSRQRVDDAIAATQRDQSSLRLPQEFEIHTSCGSCNAWIRALGSCEGELWTRVDLLDPVEPPGLPPGWAPLRDDDERRQILAELRREIPAGHVLHGRRMTPLARRRTRDDLLVRVIGAEAPLYLVHLTWRAESTPDWPRAEPFSDLSALASAASDP